MERRYRRIIGTGVDERAGDSAVCDPSTYTSHEWLARERRENFRCRFMLKIAENGKVLSVKKYLDRHAYDIFFQ